MENRQRTIRKLLWRITAVLAVLAVVSICFVSGTFARYVSNRNGSTVTEVAKWDIDFTLENNQPLTTSTFALVNKLSPSKNAFTVGSGGTVTNRKKSSGTVLVLKIENKGDVDATLTITPPAQKALTFYGYAENGTDAAATAYEGWSDSTNGGFKMEDGLVTQAPKVEEAQAVITMEFALTTEEITDQNESKFESEWKPLSGLNLDKLILKAANQEGGAGGTTGDDTSTGEETQAGDETQTTETSVYYFYVRSVWTSRDQHYYQLNQTTAEEMSDGLDTWLGENIAALGGEFTFAAIQASEWPAKDNTP